MIGRRVYEHLIRLGRLLQNEDRTGSDGLQPVHVHALDYLSRCNRYSDRPLAVAEYLGVTKGTASQTLAVLEDRGLIQKAADTADLRVVRLRVTPRGRKLLKQCAPPPRLRAALANLSPKTVEQIGASLGELLATLQRDNDGRSFGVCHSCLHFGREPNQRFRCGLTGEPLTRPETGKICREHAAPVTDAAQRPFGG